MQMFLSGLAPPCYVTAEEKKLFTMKEVGATMQTLLHLRKKSRKNYLQRK